MDMDDEVGLVLCLCRLAALGPSTKVTSPSVFYRIVPPSAESAPFRRPSDDSTGDLESDIPAPPSCTVSPSFLKFWSFLNILFDILLCPLLSSGDVMVRVHSHVFPIPIPVTLGEYRALCEGLTLATSVFEIGLEYDQRLAFCSAVWVLTACSSPEI